jgi:predicted NBD/HSP70 family sugar kinase
MSRTATAGGARVTRREADPGRLRPLAEIILRLIWKEQEISRAEIARRVEVSRSTVSEIVGSLLPKGFVAEVGTGPSRGGRRPIVLRFQDDAYFILGVEMGATHVSVALTNLRGRVIAWEHREHPVRSDPRGTREIIAMLCDACLVAGRVGPRRLLGIGVAVPSPVDPAHPDRLSEIVLPEWHGQLGLESLAARYGVRLFVDNDANMGALAEHWWGAGRGIDDFAYIKIATGLGSGHVIGGEIYRGATGVAGEIGHLAMDPQGELCICGLRGCLATMVGSPALVKRAEALTREYPESRLAGTRPTIASIEDAALAGDPLAMQLTREAADHLGIAVASLLNLMNPSMVILGGGLARLGELLLEPLRETAARRTLVSSLAVAAICIEELGPRAIAVGAATLVLKSALEDSRLFPMPGRRKGAA